MHEPVRVVPGTLGDFGSDREGNVCGGLRIIVSEIVDELLDANGVLWRQAIFVKEEAARVAVRGRVHVNRKRRERRVCDFEERVLFNVTVSLRVALRLFVA